MTLEQKQPYQRKLHALMNMINELYGTEKMVLKAGKLEALSLIRSRKPEKRLLGLQRLVFENRRFPDMKIIPARDVYDFLSHFFHGNALRGLRKKEVASYGHRR